MGVAVGIAGVGAGGVGVEPSHPTFTATSAQFQNCSGTPRPSDGIGPHAGS